MSTDEVLLMQEASQLAWSTAHCRPRLRTEWCRTSMHPRDAAWSEVWQCSFHSSRSVPLVRSCIGRVPLAEATAVTISLQAQSVDSPW